LSFEKQKQQESADFDKNAWAHHVSCFKQQCQCFAKENDMNETTDIISNTTSSGGHELTAPNGIVGGARDNGGKEVANGTFVPATFETSIVRRSGLSEGPEEDTDTEEAINIGVGVHGASGEGQVAVQGLENAGKDEPYILTANNLWP